VYPVQNTAPIVSTRNRRKSLALCDGRFPTSHNTTPIFSEYKADTEFITQRHSINIVMVVIMVIKNNIKEKFHYINNNIIINIARD
jgi:hypothetical protein